MKLILSIILAFSFVLSHGQSNTNKFQKKIIPGTNIVLKLSNKFTLNNAKNTLAGFIDKSDSTIIIGAQTKMDLTIDEVFKKQIEAINFQGAYILNQKEFKHQNQKAIIIEYQTPVDSIEAILLIFGEDYKQNFLSTLFHKSRKAEIKSILLSSRIDPKVSINFNNILGFKAIESKGPLKLLNKNIANLYYEYRNKEDTLIASLNVSKSTKNRFEGMTTKECVEYTETRYFPYQKILSEKEIINLVDTVSGYEKILSKVNSSNVIQYDYITILRFKDFDIMAIGSTLNQVDIQHFREIIKSIKLE